MYQYRFVNLGPWNYVGLSSSQIGLQAAGPVKLRGGEATYLDYAFGVYDEGSFRRRIKVPGRSHGAADGVSVRCQLEVPGARFHRFLQLWMGQCGARPAGNFDAAQIDDIQLRTPGGA